MELSDLPEPDYDGTVPVDDLDVDGENPNEMADEVFELLVSRMEEFGWLGGPIVTDTDGLIADGEHRWRAAAEVGLDEVPVKQFAIDEPTRRQWRQDLNKIHGEHDRKRDALEFDYLLKNGKSDEVHELTSATGEDLDDVLAELRVESPTVVPYDYDVDHNVYFEDCVDGLDRLDDDSVDVLLADPPYGVNYSEGAGIGERNYNFADIEGDLDEQEAVELFDAMLGEARRTLTDSAHVYVFASWKTDAAFRQVLEAHGFEIRSRCIWVKQSPNNLSAFGKKDTAWFSRQHEGFYFATLAEGEPRDFPETHADVFCYQRPRPDGRNPHPTQKPLGLLKDLLHLSSDPGDRVLDPFMGSGSTAVAAIEADRDYVGFELDEETYGSVIDRRIQEAQRQTDATTDDVEEAAS